MDFLEICQSVAREAGITTTGPTSTVDQTGILSKVVGWVKKADIEIQLKQDDWDFHWATSNGTLNPNQKSYLPADLGALSLKEIDVALINDEEVEVMDWVEYKNLYRRTGKSNQTALKPSAVIKAPNGSVFVYPVPTVYCTIQLDYYIRPTYMVASTDESLIPEEYRESIVQLALMHYSESEEDTLRYSQAKINYASWLKIMTGDVTNKITFE